MDNIIYNNSEHPFYVFKNSNNWNISFNNNDIIIYFNKDIQSVILSEEQTSESSHFKSDVSTSSTITLPDLTDSETIESDLDSLNTDNESKEKIYNDSIIKNEEISDKSINKTNSEDKKYIEKLNKKYYKLLFNKEIELKNYISDIINKNYKNYNNKIIDFYNVSTKQYKSIKNLISELNIDFSRTNNFRYRLLFLSINNITDKRNIKLDNIRLNNINDMIINLNKQCNNDIKIINKIYTNHDVISFLCTKVKNNNFIVILLENHKNDKYYKRFICFYNNYD